MNFGKIKIGDVLRINDEIYQVLDHTSSWYDFSKNTLEMVIGLVKLSEKLLRLRFFLFYMRDKPDKPLRMEELNVKTGKYKKINLELILVKEERD